MFDRLESYFNSNSSFGIVLLRAFVGLRVLYGVIDNIISWDRMIEFGDFLQTYSFPYPLISAVISVYVQFFGSLLILIGYKIRPAAFILACNFLVAILFVHIKGNDSIETMTGALAMFFGCLTLLFTGSDKFALGRN